MSDEGRAYVKLYSTFTGTTFWVHYVFGDMANAQHRYELFCGDAYIRHEWRALSLRAIKRARAELVASGHLTVIDDRRHAGHPAVYRFEFLGHEEMRKTTGDDLAPVQGPDRPPAGPDSETCPIIGTEGTNTPESDPFDEFYAVYPLHKAPDAARRAFTRALKRASFEEIMNGARCYRDDPTRKPDFTKHPATWLNAGCWQDYAEDPAGHAEALPPGGIRPFPPAEVGPDFSVDADARRAQRERLAALKAGT